MVLHYSSLRKLIHHTIGYIHHKKEIMFWYTECGPLEKGMANRFSILALRTPWTVWKGYSSYFTNEESEIRGSQVEWICIHLYLFAFPPSIFIFDGCTSPSLVPNGIFKYSAHFLHLKRNSLKICATWRQWLIFLWAHDCSKANKYSFSGIKPPMASLVAQMVKNLPTMWET